MSILFLDNAGSHKKDYGVAGVSRDSSNIKMPALPACLAGSYMRTGPTLADAMEPTGVRSSRSEIQGHGDLAAGALRPGRKGSPSLSRSRVLHKPSAIAVWADLRITRIELAAVHVGVIVRLILVGNEIDADFAVLLAVRHELVLQGLPNRRVLRCKGLLR